MSRREYHQRPPHAYDPRAAAAAAWHGAASTSAGANPYAPNPQFLSNPLNHILQNPIAMAALHHLHQQQYRPPFLPSHAYHQNPTPNLQHRPAMPNAPAAPPAPAPATPQHPQPQPQLKSKPQAQPKSKPQGQPQPQLKSKPQAQPKSKPQGQPQPQPQPQPQLSGDQHTVLGRAQTAARKARDELVRAGEGVTGWKVAQAVLETLKVDSWASLGVQLHDVPLLRDLFLIEGKVNTFIHCYVAARKILSIYDLEVEICKNQGVGQFKELELGPFLKHPLVAHYFVVPADLSKVPKLSSEEIVNCLQKFMDNSNEKVTVENFLNYLVEKKSVSGKEKLGVRIQSLGLHVSFLRESRRNEVASLKHPGNTIIGFFKNNTLSPGDSSREKVFSKNTNFHLGKKALDKKFDAITSRIKQLPGINKHIHFDSTDDEIDGDTSSEGDPIDVSENKNLCSVVNKKDVNMRTSSCPYPSKTEEMERLGLTSEISKKPALGNSNVKESGKKVFSGGKRKYEENDGPSSSCKTPKKQQKVQMQKHDSLATCSLSIGKLEKFITTWKEACHEHPVQQVLELVVNYYGKTPKEKRKIVTFFSQYPGIGFLNVAVRSMGHGLLDSIYDVIHVFSENKSSSSPIPNTTTAIMEIEPPSKEIAKCTGDGISNSKKGNNEPEHSVSSDDVIRRIAEYFESNNGLSGASQVGKSISLSTLHDCETSVTTQFLAKQFSALGHGTFLEFLTKHGHQFPHKLCSSLKWGNSGSSPMEVSVLQQQIEILLSQADANWLEDDNFSEDIFCKLLQRQFPTIDFDIEQNKSGEGLAGSIERLRKGIQTNNMTFSISLLEKRWSGIWPGNHDIVDGLKNSVVQQSYYSGTVCSREAINSLLKAPMLSDLLLWSHWNLLFAPSLGPFINWLLNTGPIRDLACIVTTDGRFIRVDPSATVDQFLEAITQCSPFQVAVKLLSLLHIYKGSANTPLSLLKCYAQRAIDIIMNNSNDMFNGNSEGKTVMPEEPHHPSAKQHDSSTNFIGHFHERSQLSFARNVRSNILSNTDGTVNLIAKFILDCLGHLPPEFRCLAADVLLSGLRTVTKNCYSTILDEATEAWQRCMLHDIGLSLGVAEWVEDCHGFCLTEEVDAKAEMHSSSRYTSASEGPTHENSMLIDNDVHAMDDRSKLFPAVKDQVVVINNKNLNILNPIGTKADIANLHGNKSSMTGEMNLEEAALVVETIRREEFGLDQALSYTEDNLLKKQHARLGRALHCLSQELYSQDSHLLLELVQNADDNTYLEDVEPTLAFVLQENGIVVLNNERGFSAENIRALCDIGNSTKKGSNRGYIGNKGIGFKSVFRVTDAPEIHSNGFHVKFDISEGQIGFILPTVIPPYCTSSVGRMLSVEDEDSCSFWNTCILLPFKSKFKEGTGMSSIASMFSDLHPSLLLFLHRLKCVKFKNVLNNRLLVMRRKALSDGIVRISHGNEIMSWLVVRKKLQGTIVRHDVCTTEIAVAFTLQETEKGEFEPYLKQQPVFAFLPLRNYGLKFILQGDFVLPSSREEVDADSAWNQWLLSEFPSLFVSAQESFCALPCFQSCPGKAVTAFMSFVPLAGEVHGFFCQLPHLIISKLRLMRCMVLESSSLQLVYPCNTLRGWDEQTRMLFSDSLLHEHLGLGYLSKDIIISDTLSRALGIHEYGPNVFIDFISSICRSGGCIESLGLDWLCAWFSTLHLTLLSHSSRNPHLTTSFEDDLLDVLRKIPCIPLSDGSFCSVADGPIWLPSDILHSTPNCKSSMQNFPVLYNSLQIVSPDLLSVSSKNKYLMEEMRTNDLIDILLKIGVRKLSGHDIVKNHILVALANGADAKMANKLMIEYVTFVMLHLQSSCTRCSLEKEEIMSELRRRPILLTNYGYKCPADEPIHFSKEYGNYVDIGRLLHNVEFKWAELDSCYLMNHDSSSLVFEMKKWREFFEELGVTDFVQVVKVEKKISQFDSFLAGRLTQGDSSETFCTVYDWDSPELANILSTFSSIRCRDNCIYLLEILNRLWDDYYSVKTSSVTNVAQGGENRTVQSSFLNCIQSFKWIASTMDEDLHYATDLFYDFEDMRSLFGSVAPYAVPQVSSRSLVKDIGFKTKVSHSDALMILNSWIASPVPFSASMDQMRKFYTFMSEGVIEAKVDIKREFLQCSSIFTPLCRPRSSGVLPGKFLSPKEIYWHDPTGCSEVTEEFISTKMSVFPRRMLSAAYPSLCEFFTVACGVPKVPTTSDYVDILLQLSNAALPSQVSNQVFRVFVRWANDLCSANDKMNDILFLKESLEKLEITIFPTLLDKWVSLHPSFGLVCWVDDDELKQHFKDCSDVNFIQFGGLSYEDKQMLYGRVAVLMKSLGIPALSKVVYREAIFYGTGDNSGNTAVICWLLPYMQRYIYKIHRDTYMNFQENDIMKLNNLRVIVVERLFHKYMLKGHESSSKRRFKCHCLLQGNNLYATKEADSHSVFLELSRFFFDGSPDLHFANFLHMVKTMADSGTTVEQIESFIINNQNVPKLPVHEVTWSFSSLFVAEPSVDSQMVEFQSACELNTTKHQRTMGVVSSWPPNDWKTAPDFGASCRSQNAPMEESKVNDTLLDLSKPAEYAHTGDTWVPVELEGDCTIKEDLRAENTLLVECTTSDEPQMVMSVDSSSAPAYLDLETTSPIVDAELTDFNDKLTNVSEERNKLCRGAADASQLRTGRLGEAVVHKYFVERLGSNSVRWVNEESETGLPYDLVITRGEGFTEYIEVKATVSSKKDWFYVTLREWQFALEKGDSFTIAHVVLSGSKKANIVTFKNPHKLCQQKSLRLALLIAGEHKSS